MMTLLNNLLLIGGAYGTARAQDEATRALMSAVFAVGLSRTFNQMNKE